MDYSIDIKEIFTQMTPFIKPFGKPILLFLLIVFPTSSFQWILTYTYNKQCIDLTFYGFIKHTFNLGSPFCQFINFLQFELSKKFVTIWVTAGVTVISLLTSKIAYSSSYSSSSSSSDSSVSE